MVRKKIGYVVNDLAVGGLPKVLIDLCNGLEKKHFEIHVFVLSRKLSMLDNFPLNKDVKLHVIPYAFSTGYSLIDYLKNSYHLTPTYERAKEILSLIVKLRIDILHFHTLPRQLTIGVLAKKLLPQLKLIFTDHSLRFSKGEYKKYQEILLSMAYRKLYRNYHVIAVSESIYDSLQKKKFIAKNKQLFLLENTIQLEKYRVSEKKTIPENNSLIYISRINFQKGHEILIKAWKNCLKSPEDHLYIIGPDETEGYHHRLAGDDSSIIFTGSIGNLHPYLQRSTIGVFPSEKEGLPLSLLEMMAYELPVIVSDIEELTNLVKDKKEGLHFNLNDEKDLRSKIELLMVDKKMANRLGKAARKKVEKICKKNDPISFHQKFYSDLVNSF